MSKIAFGWFCMSRFWVVHQGLAELSQGRWLDPLWDKEAVLTLSAVSKLVIHSRSSAPVGVDFGQRAKASSFLVSVKDIALPGLQQIQTIGGPSR